MTHVSEHDLILYYYGELVESAIVEHHLGVCPECRGNYRAMQVVLNMVDGMPVPERSLAYGAEVWAKLEPRLGGRRMRWFGVLPRRWVAIAAMALVVIAAFLAGRYSPGTRPSQPSGETEVAENVRERILMVAVGDHLERSQMVLVELVNARPQRSGIDISDEQRWAEDLIETNRLYRQTASMSGDAGLTSLLEELERVLLDVVHEDPRLSAARLNELRQRIESKGILFKVRVAGAQLRQQEDAPPAGDPL